MAVAKATRTAAKADRRRKAISPRPILQWIAAGAGLLITLAASGVILAEALQPVRPVALSVRVDGEHQAGQSRILDIVVTNAGSETAAAVEIAGKAGEETASVTLDYVPGDGEATAALAFPAGTPGEPAISVAGWSAP